MYNNSYNNNDKCDGREEICKILKKIDKMQKEAVRFEIQDDFCDFDKLGGCGLGRSKFNTRPLEIYTHEDKAWTCPIRRDNGDCRPEGNEVTCVFRVEKIEDGLVTFRALIEENGHDYSNENEHSHEKKFKQTNSFKAILVKDIGAIRCLKDAFVDICIR